MSRFYDCIYILIYLCLCQPKQLAAEVKRADKALAYVQNQARGKYNSVCIEYAQPELELTAEIDQSVLSAAMMSSGGTGMC